MDVFAALRTIGGLGTVLGLLAVAMWLVKRYGLVVPAAAAGGRRRLAIVERLTIDPRRTLLLVRRDSCEHLVLVGPDAMLLIDSAIAAEPSPVAPALLSNRRAASRAA